MILLDLFFSFFQIGLLSFGGGYAMISLLQEMILSKGWLTISEFTDIVALSQVTPGAIAINMATFIGFYQAGILGALISALAVAFPSVLIIVVVLRFLKTQSKSKLVQDIFYGLRPAVCGLILAAVLQIAEMEFAARFAAIPFSIVVLVVLWKCKLNPALVIVFSAIAGILLF